MTNLMQLLLLLILLMFSNQNAVAQQHIANTVTNTINELEIALPVLSINQVQSTSPPCLLGTEASCRCKHLATTLKSANGDTEPPVAKTLSCGDIISDTSVPQNDFFKPLSGDGDTNRTRLDVVALEGDSLRRMNYKHYALPAGAAEPNNIFEGRLILNKGIKTRLNFKEVGTEYIDDIVDEDQLPIFDFTFVQFGSHIIPQQRGLINAPESSSWEWLLEPGRVWDEQGDDGFSRASIPFALQENNANCTHNGVLSFLFKSNGEISNVAVQIAGETCLYFNYNMWGMVSAEYILEDVGTANVIISEYLSEVDRRMPVKPISELSVDYASEGVDYSQIATEQGADISTFGVAIDGTHYSGSCSTRYGDYPYCEVMSLPSYSTAKTIFAAYALALISQQDGSNIREQIVADYAPECNGDRWDDVTFENLIDMATGNYNLSSYEGDEGSSATNNSFFLVHTNNEKIDHSCNQYPRKSPPGTKMIYHSSDTYILGNALDDYIGSQDIYEKVVNEIYKPLGLSPVTYKAVRTIDAKANMYYSHGMTLHKDDFIKAAEFLTKSHGKINGQQVIDAAIVSDMLMQSDDVGLATFNIDNRYLNGVWVWDMGSNNIYDCPPGTWVPYMSGYGGIAVIMFPNDMVYYYVSDSGANIFNSTARELQKIRSFCPNGT